jgi:isoquinoline 1-oxidoreductase alpha subunit
MQCEAGVSAAMQGLRMESAICVAVFIRGQCLAKSEHWSAGHRLRLWLLSSRVWWRVWLQRNRSWLQNAGLWMPRGGRIAGSFGGRRMAQFVLEVNGETRTLDVDGEMPLLWALRDELALTGTKYGCGIGMCGACTVHLNGEATRSCQTTVADARGKKITTIEGLSRRSGNSSQGDSAGTALHVVQSAWITEQVPQCGYCQSGQIMSAAALLRAHRDPTDAEIDDAMAGNICRCATYFRIRKAIHTAAREMRA